jgi:ubiquitin C-terminal hydrolase
MPSMVAKSASKIALEQLCRLFCQMSFSNRPTIRPHSLKSALPEFFQNFQQHDCSEFAKVFLDQLEKEVKAMEKRNIIYDHFQGKLIQRIECDTCHSVSSTNQDYTDISLSLDLKEELKKEESE